MTHGGGLVNLIGDVGYSGYNLKDLGSKYEMIRGKILMKKICLEAMKVQGIMRGQN
jgi:hypothetical protein